MDAMSTNSIKKHPFEAVRVRHAFLWLILGVVLQFLSAIYFAYFGYDKSIALTISLVTIQGMLVLWAVTEMRRGGISVKKLFFGNGFSLRNTWRDFLMVIPGFIFSIGSLLLITGLIGMFLNINPESLLERNESLSASPESLAIPVLYYALVFIFTLIVAPITEELAFRGMLINRWSWKWGVGTAIVISSLLFGLLHGLTFVGTAVFALLISSIYLKTRSLIPGIIFHSIHNLIPFLAIINESLSQAESKANIVAETTAGAGELLVGGGVLVAISLPIIILYLWKNWPSKDTPIPYIHTAD